jgi:hypothetical protein
MNNKLGSIVKLNLNKEQTLIICHDNKRLKLIDGECWFVD